MWIRRVHKSPSLGLAGELGWPACATTLVSEEMPGQHTHSAHACGDGADCRDEAQDNRAEIESERADRHGEQGNGFTLDIIHETHQAESKGGTKTDKWI